MDTSDESDSVGELWTTGQAADYLSDVGISRKRVSEMINNGELGGWRRSRQKWAKVPASVVREYKRKLLEGIPKGDEAPPGDTV